MGCDSWGRKESDTTERLNSSELKWLRSEGDQSWVFFGRNDAKVETPVLWPPYVKS